MSTAPLEQAPPATQLAVELILLLEQNDIDCDTALQAIAIVQRDFLRKKQQQNPTKTNERYNPPRKIAGGSN